MMKTKPCPMVYGNLEDKANLKNPLSKWLVRGFDNALFGFLADTRPSSIHEVGCGEGRLLRRIATTYDVPLRGTELSKDLVEALAGVPALSKASLVVRSIYDLDPHEDAADVVVCCEVLEHLDDPARGLAALRRLNARAYILSVPSEPLWCFLNLLRGKYWRSSGNTPGHLQRWSCKGFLALLHENGFKVECVRRPTPWTMVIAHVSELSKAMHSQSTLQPTYPSSRSLSV